MKPKFHPGDRVTVIKPYVAPIPDYVKDSEIFNDLYKVFGLDKDIRGVKPGDTYTIIEAESKPRTRSDGKTVYAYSYQGKSGKRSDFVLWEDEIKLIEATKPARKTMTKSRIPSPSRSKSPWTTRPKLTASLTKLSSWLSSPMPLSPRPPMIPLPSPGLMTKSQQPAKRLLNCPPASRNRAAI